MVGGVGRVGGVGILPSHSNPLNDWPNVADKFADDLRDWNSNPSHFKTDTLKNDLKSLLKVYNDIYNYSNDDKAYITQQAAPGMPDANKTKFMNLMDQLGQAGLITGQGGNLSVAENFDSVVKEFNSGDILNLTKNNCFNCSPPW